MDTFVFTFTDHKEFEGNTYCDLYAFSVVDRILHVRVDHFAADMKSGFATTNFRVAIVAINENKTINWDYRNGSTNAGYGFDDPWISQSAKKYAERMVQLMAFW